MHFFLRIDFSIFMRLCYISRLDDICEKILKLLDDNLIPNSNTGESKVFYYKMKGDYYRYIAEYKSDDAKKTAADNAHDA